MFGPQTSAPFKQPVYASIHSTSEKVDDDVDDDVDDVVVPPDTTQPAIDGKRRAADGVTLTREAAPFAPVTAAINEIKPNVLMMFFIPFLHFTLYLFYHRHKNNESEK